MTTESRTITIKIDPAVRQEMLIASLLGNLRAFKLDAAKADRQIHRDGCVANLDTTLNVLQDDITNMRKLINTLRHISIPDVQMSEVDYERRCPQATAYEGMQGPKQLR